MIPTTVPNPGEGSETGYKSRQTVLPEEEENDCVGDGAKRGEKRSSLEESFQIHTPTAETLYGCPEAGEKKKQLQALSKLFVCQPSLWAACGTASCESNTSRWNSSAHLGAHYCSTEPLNSMSQVDIAHCH